MPLEKRQHATFRFYGELNDFLPTSLRPVELGCESLGCELCCELGREFRCDFELPATVKDMFESIGVPHPEVDLILVNGEPVDFCRLVKDRDRIAVCPAFRALDTGLLPRLRPPLEEYRFVVDAHLGKLARYLRVLGFDALYQADGEDKELARASHDARRVLLTRDLGLLKRSEVVYGYFVRATEPKQQAVEVLRRFNLFAAAAPFRRCTQCNAELDSVAKESILDRLKPRTRQYYDRFRICPVCRRIYWEGSHYRHMNHFVQETLAGQTTSHSTS